MTKGYYDDNGDWIEKTYSINEELYGEDADDCEGDFGEFGDQIDALEERVALLEAYIEETAEESEKSISDLESVHKEEIRQLKAYERQLVASYDSKLNSAIGAKARAKEELEKAQEAVKVHKHTIILLRRRVDKASDAQDVLSAHENKIRKMELEIEKSCDAQDIIKAQEVKIRSMQAQIDAYESNLRSAA